MDILINDLMTIFNYNVTVDTIWDQQQAKERIMSKSQKKMIQEEKTGQVISEQSGVEGQRKEVNVESYSKVAALGQILKDMEFPADKNKVIEYVKQSSNAQNKEEILAALQQKLEEREYKNVSDITMAAGLVY
jgi:hypothetical protein